MTWLLAALGNINIQQYIAINYIQQYCLLYNINKSNSNLKPN